VPASWCVSEVFGPRLTTDSEREFVERRERAESMARQVRDLTLSRQLAGKVSAVAQASAIIVPLRGIAARGGVARSSPGTSLTLGCERHTLAA